MFRASSGSVWLYTSLNGAFLRSPIYLSSSNLEKDLYVSNVCPSLGILTPFFDQVQQNGIMVTDTKYRDTDFLDVRGR